MPTLIQDIRYALRMLRKNPTFTATAILTLTLGIAANITVFVAVDAFLLRLMPVPEAEQLVRFYSGDGNFGVFSYADYLDFKTRTRSFTGMAARALSDVGFGRGSGIAENARAELVTGEFFSILGVRPMLGRVILPSDDRAPGASPVAVLSYPLWKHFFGGNAAAVGQKVIINGKSFTVVGVMPQRFTGSNAVESPDFWAPLMMYDQLRPRGISIDNRRWGWLDGIARMKPGVSIGQAQADASRVALQLRKEYKSDDAESAPFRLVPAGAVPEAWRSGLRKPLQLLTVVVAFVLLVAAANIAGVLLSRMIAQRQEIAVRSILGATRFRILKQWLVESLLLALLAGVAGFLLSLWSRDMLQWWVPAEIASVIPAFQISSGIVLYTFLLVLITGLLCGIIPAYHLNQISVATLLKEKAGKRSSRIFGGLIIGQVCLSFVLLLLAGLLLQNLHNSKSFQIGFHTENLIVAEIDLRRNAIPEESGRQFYKNLMDRFNAIPALDDVTLALVTPLSGNEESQGYQIDGYQGVAGKATFSIANNVVGARYFKTMGIPIIRGRGFIEADALPAAKSVVVINETMARRFWSLDTAVGKKIHQAGTDTPMEIVGIAKDIKYYALGEDPMAYLYGPFGKQYSPFMSLHVRFRGDEVRAMDLIRSEIGNVNPNVAISHLQTFSDMRRVQLFPATALTALCSFFGGLTLLLTTLGIYGTVSYSVNQRVREIGIRMALGAQKKDVLQLFMRRSVWLTAAGTGIGFLFAFWFTKFIGGLLFQIHARDPLSFVAAALVMLVAAILACLLPCLRAIRTNPSDALRYE